MSVRIPRTPRRPLAPSARRLDIDALVGIACMLMLPVAFWLV